MTNFRLGLLIPSSNTTMEQEFRIMLPREASIHAARIRLREVAVNELIGMEREIEREALKLADADVDVIGFGCTSGSLAKGLGHDEEIVKRITRVTKKPAVATAGAVVEALRSLGFSKISVATPYTEEINVLERRFLKQNGFSIEKMAGLNLIDNLKIARLRPETVFNLAKKVNSVSAESVFLSCTNMPTIDVIAKLEKTFAKPVVSSNIATLWAMLKRTGFSLKTGNYGKLFAS
jgi:maleate isomerase